MMTWDEILIWGSMIFCSDLAAVVVWEVFKAWRNRKLDIGCDYCEECKPLNRTPDKSAYLCRQCMEAFFNAHEGEFTEEQMTKARKVYRRLKRRKDDNRRKVRTSR